MDDERPASPTTRGTSSNSGNTAINAREHQHDHTLYHSHTADTTTLEPHPNPSPSPSAAPSSSSKWPPATSRDHRHKDTPSKSTAMDDTHASQSANDSEDGPKYTATTTTTRRNASGKISSVYSGNRIRYLKKNDGEPFWRSDIQYNFLQCVFNNEKAVFTKTSDGTSGHTFADIYVDAMAKSSKCSQVLKEKLATDKTAAIEMAMICLLVNVGRMNTTLNFFPEMRARVRTFHSIPCLQAHHGRYVKQLQDGPRLKSILKGATEDTEQPTSIEDVISSPKPRTNPVNLLFVLSQCAPRISAHHFYPSRDFFDLFMEPKLSSRSRANAFLWIMWWYLESNFTAEDASKNPFGAGIANPEDPVNNSLPDKVPPLEELTEEEAAAENVDTEEEKAYAEQKKRERMSICDEDPPRQPWNSAAARKALYNNMPGDYLDGDPGMRPKASPHPSLSDFDRGRSSLTPPRRLHGDPDGTQSPSPAPSRERSRLAVNALLNDEPRLAATPNGPSILPRHRSSRNKGISRRDDREPPPLRPAPPSDSLYDSPHRLSSSHGGPPQYHFSTTDSPSGSLRQASMPGTSVFPQRDGSKGGGQDGSVGTGGHGKRSRLGPSREERIDRVLHHDVREFRHRKRRDRRRRGVIIDAWIKCKELPDVYDSESDASNAPGLPVPARRPKGGIDDAWESEDEQLGDAGDRNSTLARIFRRTGRLLNGSSAIPRTSRTTRSTATATRGVRGGRRGDRSGIGSSAFDNPSSQSVSLGRQRSFSSDRRGSYADKVHIAPASSAGGAMSKEAASATVAAQRKRGVYKRRARSGQHPGEGTIVLQDSPPTRGGSHGRYSSLKSRKKSRESFFDSPASAGTTGTPRSTSSRMGKGGRRSIPAQIDIEGSDADLTATPGKDRTPRSGRKSGLSYHEDLGAVSGDDEGHPPRSVKKSLKRRRESNGHGRREHEERSSARPRSRNSHHAEDEMDIDDNEDRGRSFHVDDDDEDELRSRGRDVSMDEY